MSTVAGVSPGFINGIGTVAKFRSPAGVCVNNVGGAPTVLYVADTHNHAIRAIGLAVRNTSTLAGSGSAGWADGVGSAARFNLPYMCAVDSTNTYMYVTDMDNGAIRRINLASRSVTTIIGKSCMSSTASCVSPNAGCCLPGLSNSSCSDGSCYLPGAGASSSLYQAQSLVLSYNSPCDGTAGCLWVTSQLGTLSVVDLSASPPAMTMAACIDPSGNSCTSCTSSGGCADYPSTQVQGVALDGANPPNILVALRIPAFAVWQCTPVDSLSALASCTRDVGQGVGHQYVEDITSSGISLLFGSLGSWGDESVGTPLSAGLISPWGLAFDASAAALFLADQNVVRFSNFVSGNPANVITVAGGATKVLPGIAGPGFPNHWVSPAPANINVPGAGYTNGIGTNAAFNAPSNIVAVHATRMLYVADSSNHCVRSITYFL